MARRKRKKAFDKMSVIYITAIVSLSMMGVGYGYWSENINIGVSVTTGNLKASFSEENENIEGLEGFFSEDSDTLKIIGTIPKDHSGIIPIKIINKGSIPIDLQGSVIEVNSIGTYELYVPVKDIVEELASIESLIENLIMMEYDENTETIEQSQEINELINSMNTMKQYRFTKEIKVDQGL